MSYMKKMIKSALCLVGAMLISTSASIPLAKASHKAASEIVGSKKYIMPTVRREGH